MIKYTYDATGNRIGKWVQVGAGTPKQTAYVRDASGNVMAIYEKGNSEVNGGLLSQIEVPLYGSSRLGVWRPDREVETTGWELFDTDPMTGTGGGIAGGWERGRVQFELSNHLGNVLVTISDVRIPVLMPEGIELCDDPVHPACYRPIDYYLPQVLTANDYYPGGMLMPGRKFAEDESYRYGFNGQEKSTEIDLTGNSMTAEFWQYDARIVRRWNVDPDITEAESPYMTFNGNPIFKSDILGNKPDDWYKDKDGNYRWFEGSDNRKGYTNVGKSKTIRSVAADRNGNNREIRQTYLLNSDGSATSMATTYRDGQTITTEGGHTIKTKENVPSIGESIISGGSYFLDQINPFEKVDVYVSVNVKINYETNIAGYGKVKASAVYGGAQVGLNSDDGLYADVMTFDKSYVSFEKIIGGVKNEFRIQPVNGLLGNISTTNSGGNMRGEYSPQVRVLTTIPGLERNFFGGILKGTVQTEFGYKAGDSGPTLGVRGKIETPSSFNIGGHQIIIPVSVEASGGIRIKFKVPKFFN